MSNLEDRIAISPSSIFHVASISKQFTAAAIQRLALEGKLSLDDDIRKYIPEMPDFGHRITLNHLMHHASGLRDQWDLQDLAGWRDDDLITENDILDMVKRQKGLNFLPGENYLYCNTGFTLLAITVKRVTGVSLRDYADSAIFRPLGMTSTHFHSDHSEVVPNRTSAYERDDRGRWKISIPVFDNYGATSLFTTASDLAKWDENFYSKQVGGNVFIDAMLKPGLFNNGKEQNYASGLALGQYKGNNMVEHGGSDAGYRAEFLRFPDQHLAVIVLCNLANINPGDLGRKVADLFLTDLAHRAPEAQPASMADTLAAKKWTGEYFHVESKARVKIALQHGQLTSNDAALKPMNDSLFINPNSGVRYLFGRDGNRSHFVLMAGNSPDRVFEQVFPVHLTGPNLSPYAGTFYSEELDVKYEISVKDSTLSLKIPRNDPMKLIPYIKDWFTGPFTIEYVRDKKGRITGFLLSTGRSWNLPFIKSDQPSPGG
jgi:CubicO group peptidase (beta-lactamase class C family)